MFGKLCFDLVSKFEMVNEQNYGTDVEQFKGHDKKFILHCVRFRSGQIPHAGTLPYGSTNRTRLNGNGGEQDG